MECVYYVKEREMLSIPHEMSFIPNLLRNYFNHVVKCRMRVPFVTQESLFVNENLIL